VKKITVLFIAILLISLVFTGCKPQEEAAGFRAGMLTDLGGLSASEETKGFSDLGWDAFLKAKTDLGIEVTLVECREQADYEPNIEKLVTEGYDIVVGVGFLITDAINNMAAKYPDSKFAIVDNVVDQPNVMSLVFAEQEGSFLVGALAGGMTQTGIIGFVGGMEIPLITKFEVGYIAGARTLNPEIEVLVGYTGVFTDPVKGKEVSLAQFNNGADIIYAAAGSCGLGTVEAATEQGKYAIGVDTDQDALSKGFVLASMLKHVEVAVYDAIKAAKDGTFAGGIREYNLKVDGVGVSPMTYTKDKIPQSLLDTIDRLSQMIKDGTIIVPTTQDELNAFVPPTL
jgi:basic membrane protein A and related proteins